MRRDSTFEPYKPYSANIPWCIQINKNLMEGSTFNNLDSCAVCGRAAAHRCSACKGTAYCGGECQKRDWHAGHRIKCKLYQQSSLSAKSLNVSIMHNPQVDLTKYAFPLSSHTCMNRGTIETKPCGIMNVGNSCYANSALQALLSTVPLKAYFQSGDHMSTCMKRGIGDWCVLCELSALCTCDCTTLNPQSLLKHVNDFGKCMTYGRQEDSHEFFINLLDTVAEVQLAERGGKAQFDTSSQHTTLPHHTFGVQICTQIECLECEMKSKTYQTELTIALRVPSHGASLPDLLRFEFGTVEKLSGVNAYKCDSCKLQCPALRSSRLSCLPSHLAFQLKRFVPGRSGKVNSKVTFSELLDLRDYGMLENNESSQYSLYAIIVHLDWDRSIDCGHYIAYVKRNATWYKCDDQSVSPVSAYVALAAGAYMLFYRRESTDNKSTPSLSSDTVLITGPESGSSCEDCPTSILHKAATAPGSVMDTSTFNKDNIFNDSSTSNSTDEEELGGKIAIEDVDQEKSHVSVSTILCSLQKNPKMCTKYHMRKRKTGAGESVVRISAEIPSGIKDLNIYFSEVDGYQRLIATTGDKNEAVLDIPLPMRVAIDSLKPQRRSSSSDEVLRLKLVPSE